MHPARPKAAWLPRAGLVGMRREPNRPLITVCTLHSMHTVHGQPKCAYKDENVEM